MDWFYRIVDTIGVVGSVVWFVLLIVLAVLVIRQWISIEELRKENTELRRKFSPIKICVRPTTREYHARIVQGGREIGESRFGTTLLEAIGNVVDVDGEKVGIKVDATIAIPQQMPRTKNGIH